MFKYFVLVTAFMITCQFAYSHGGRTNANGCHNDNVNGGFHCHGNNEPKIDEDKLDEEIKSKLEILSRDIVCIYYFNDTNSIISEDASVNDLAFC